MLKLPLENPFQRQENRKFFPEQNADVFHQLIRKALWKKLLKNLNCFLNNLKLC